jgi:FKBP-type peptidyl-prolyl cis-trans isomerase FklB
MRLFLSAVVCFMFFGAAGLFGNAGPFGTSLLADEKATPPSDAVQPTADATSGSTDETFENDLQRTSYAIGVSIGRGLKKDGAALDAELLGQGIADVLLNRQTRLSNDEVRAAVIAFQKRQKAAAIRSAAPADQLAFLKSNALEKDVVLLYGGLQYRVLTAGDGARPTASDKVKVRYRGTLVDGTEFDKTEDEPASFGLSGLIPGWQMALPRMNVGSKWQLVVPPELAYGDQDKPDIPANSVLVFEIELVGIE